MCEASVILPLLCPYIVCVPSATAVTSECQTRSNTDRKQPQLTAPPGSTVHLRDKLWFNKCLGNAHCSFTHRFVHSSLTENAMIILLVCAKHRARHRVRRRGIRWGLTLQCSPACEWMRPCIRRCDFTNNHRTERHVLKPDEHKCQ